MRSSVESHHSCVDSHSKERDIDEDRDAKAYFYLSLFPPQASAGPSTESMFLSKMASNLGNCYPAPCGSDVYLQPHWWEMKTTVLSRCVTPKLVVFSRLHKELKKIKHIKTPQI